MRDVAERRMSRSRPYRESSTIRAKFPKQRGSALDAIRQLGYRPNIVARVGLRSYSVGRPHHPQITDPFFPEWFRVESVAHRQGYSVFRNTNEDPQQELDYIDILSQQVDGIIPCGSRLMLTA